MPKLVKQSDLEVQYEIFDKAGDATPRMTALRLARFAEAKMLAQVRNERFGDAAKSLMVLTIFGVLAVSVAVGVMASVGGGLLVFGLCCLTAAIMGAGIFAAPKEK